MGELVLLVPEAPAPEGDKTALREVKRTAGMLRLGVLDNSKANADHLLRMIAEGVSAQFEVKSVVSLRKPSVATKARDEVLDQLASEADIVISAMAD
jgi:hypothetical protein